ncbi:unnamed protein product [Bursaphelenchus okinawaensis]|uniref:G-protein coupled receptors family 1 profile domain-containing protein n=1 Tax=Bursaphelenchus okinawaensis TaxID=465554 RepID=A0A811KIR9_9BILA|nr:unnamed protein product [Bursaphelenchus okinawaensis]CAG9103690.1 unnamed protein product [Bursaphelenchus okinawaensis]
MRNATFRLVPSTFMGAVVLIDSHNATESPHPEWRHPLVGVILAGLCLLTVSGNVLVVVAVCTKKYLRNPTGYLIVSLAFADLVVGLVVMPLNSLFEMTRHVWLLGLTMCDIFHALDILASTSSIWNLCVISLDRYMAGQDPIGYRDKVSKRRILIAIVFVWVMSACLAFPAIIWWRKTSPHLYKDQYQCVFTDNWIYVAFSSLVSFYIPMILILFAYGRVFLIATRHSRQMKDGVKKVKNKNWRPGFDDTAAQLRIHFGRARPKTSAIANVILAANGAAVNTQRIQQKEEGSKVILSRSSENGPGIQKAASERSSSSQGDFERTKSSENCGKAVENGKTLYRNINKSNSTVGTTRRENDADMVGINNMKKEASMVVLSKNDDVKTCLLAQQLAKDKKKTGMREKSRQMMKYVHEQRAARTLSIIVGAFILCWLPFFIVSPFIAVCPSCVGNHELIFSLITWAGHINSMLNPLIYSRFSRDFRKAFKQILTCQREKPTRKAIKTPLNIVFAQLVSITQLWEQPPESNLS